MHMSNARKLLESVGIETVQPYIDETLPNSKMMLDLLEAQNEPYHCPWL